MFKGDPAKFRGGPAIFRGGPAGNKTKKLWVGGPAGYMHGPAGYMVGGPAGYIHGPAGYTVAHKILVSAQVPLELIGPLNCVGAGPRGFGDKGFGTRA